MQKRLRCAHRSRQLPRAAKSSTFRGPSGSARSRCRKASSVPGWYEILKYKRLVEAAQKIDARIHIMVQLEGTKTKLEHQIANNYRKNRDRINTVSNE